MAEPPTRRLFFALWPAPELAQALTAWQAALPRHGGRRVPQHNLHLTLAFAGDVDAAMAACLQQGAEAVTAPAVALTLDRMDRFGPLLWIGPSQTPPPLAALAEQLAALLTRCGLTPDPRPYRPHVTLIRHAHRAPTQLPEPPALPWHADHFCLAESLPGQPYRLLQRYRLA